MTLGTTAIPGQAMVPGLLSKTGNSIYNDEIRLFLARKIQNVFLDDAQYAKMVCPQEYVGTFLDWIQRSRLNSIRGLHTFPEVTISLGVTQALDQFHYEVLQTGRRLRLLRGEYPYNRDVHPQTPFIEDEPLVKGDSVVVSCPFSGSGSPHPQMLALLDQCAGLNIPVFVDMAWFGTCGGIDFDLSHPAIYAVAFSLTKGLTCGNYRSGIRLARPDKRRPDVQDRLKLQFDWNHGIHLNTRIGLELMRHFDADYNFSKYRPVQLKVCENLGLTPSHCVHIATGSNPVWSDFSRDGAFNRINLREAIKDYAKKNR